ncbi:transcriptional regulator [Clostridium aceticum]|uniref:Transcriptional regulator n=1 Tax=Clostridium aceticum TaxID=84022 RepID=A0A0D8IH28_9CLOT|nr:DUF4342 domain-containing protein [Clostridium aceticum]AKL94188.1 transcriptional regulator [Clostridium aceticum]KJF28471.1 hypothetical protein TZ02_00635 [Clostridium aceticum]
MSIDLETVDLLRKRANVSYEEAKKALEESNGDLVEALIFLEKANKTKPEKNCEAETMLKGISNFAKSTIKKGNDTRLIVSKKDNNILNLSMTVTVIASIIAPVIPLAGLPLAFLTNHKIRIKKKDGEDMKVNVVLDKVSSTVNAMVNQTTKETIEKEKI